MSEKGIVFYLIPFSLCVMYDNHSDYKENDNNVVINDFHIKKKGHPVKNGLLNSL